MASNFIEFATFFNTAGLETLLFQVGATLYAYDIDNTTEYAVTIDGVTNALDPDAKSCMRMFAPYASGAPVLVYTNGVNEIIEVTVIDFLGGAVGASMLLNGASPGSTGAPLPVKTYSKPKFCEPFLDRMVYCGWQGSNTNTSRDILITNSGSYNTVTQSTPLAGTDGGIFTVPGHLGAPTGMKAFRVSNQTNDQVLIIGCQKGIAMITGHDATDFAMIVLTEEFGLLSNRAIKVLQNDVYMWTTSGIRRFSGIAEGNTLLNASMTRELNDIVLTFNKDAAGEAFAVHHQSTQEIEWWFPSGKNQTQNNMALVMNYNTDGESLEAISPVWCTRSGTTVACMIDFKDILLGGGYDGVLQVHNVEVNTYDSVAVPFNIVTAFLSPGDITAQMEIDQCLAVTEGAGQEFLVNVYAYEDMGGNSALRRNLVTAGLHLSAPQPPPAILGTWILSINGFPSDYVKLLECRPPGKARFFELEIIGNNQNHQIDFVGWQFRAVPHEARP